MLFTKLVGIYEGSGFKVRSSISPFMLAQVSSVPHEDGTFTYIVRDGMNFGFDGGGVSMSEIYLLESIAAVFRPERIFGIGCSFGWSSVALALANPQAKVVAIDIGTGTSSVGLELTNEIARREGLNLSAVHGRSPDDVPARVGQLLDGRIDLVFVDADHRDEPQLADFRAVLPYCHDKTLFLFHDIFICGTKASFRLIANELPGHDSFVLSRTASGMGVSVPKSEVELRRVVESFTDPFAPIDF